MPATRDIDVKNIVRASEVQSEIYTNMIRVAAAIAFMKAIREDIKWRQGEIRDAWVLERLEALRRSFWSKLLQREESSMLAQAQGDFRYRVNRSFMFELDEGDPIHEYLALGRSDRDLYYETNRAAPGLWERACNARDAGRTWMSVTDRDIAALRKFATRATELGLDFFD